MKDTKQFFLLLAFSSTNRMHITKSHFLFVTGFGFGCGFFVEMSINFAESLPKGIFNKMRELRVINLAENNFTGNALSGDLFKDNVELEQVILSNNMRHMMSLPNGFFANLMKLGDVTLSKNTLIRLPEDLFRGTRNLKFVDIESNFLNTLPDKIF